MAKGNPKATAKGNQPKPSKAPAGGPSTMERIAKGGPRLMSVAERVKARAKLYPKGW